MKSVRALYLAAALSAARSASALEWAFDSHEASCQGDPFANTQVTGTCYQKSGCQGEQCTSMVVDCGMGDTPVISGKVTARQPFPNGQMSVQQCMSGVCVNKEVDGRICNWLLPTNGQSCGESGNYNIDYMVLLPDAGYPGSQWVFDHTTIKIKVEKPSICETQSGSGGYGTPIFGIAVVAVAAFWGHRRRRRRRAGDGDGKESNAIIAAIAPTLAAITPGRDRRRRLAEDDSETFDDEESYVEMGSMANCSDLIAVAGLRGILAGPPEDRSVAPEGRAGAALSRERKRMPSVEEEDDDEVISAITSDIISEADAPSRKEVSLEVLKDWYNKQGIAIV